MGPRSASLLDRDPQTQKEGLLDTRSQTRRLIASLYPEMEEQRPNLHAAARAARPRGGVHGRRGGTVVVRGGAGAACFGRRTEPEVEEVVG
ncbi:hypothetical protein VZT92_000312 [Zoarces viviparus]|uniref:Uncharacterized protein n=1 Tax=Zoarces viviparus TaxID=48416 RepID=A0AAW1G526_ZOAVI